MVEQSPRLKVSTVGPATVVSFNDRKMLDEVSITQIGDQLSSLIAEPGTPKLVLDFTNVSHMSSSALGMLITLHKRIRDKNGQLRLCCIQPAIFEVFVITRLNEILKISNSPAEAVETLQ